MSFDPLFRLVSPDHAFSAPTRFWVFEPPRTRGPRRYVLGVDVSDGIGRDFSVIDVQRVGTIEEPAEEVAQFITNRVTPTQLAYAVKAIGLWYKDDTGYEAQAVIECNNHGLSTQDTLQLHLGYSHFYRWEYYDAADPSKRFSTKIGWVTTPRTRPLLLAKFHDAITAVDPLTKLPDLLLNSPVTIDQLKDFRTEGSLAEAEASRGKHDDAILATAIAYYASWRLAGGERLPLDERRRMKHAAEVNQIETGGQTVDWRNSDATSQEQAFWSGFRVDERETEEMPFP